MRGNLLNDELYPFIFPESECRGSCCVLSEDYSMNKGESTFKTLLSRCDDPSSGNSVSWSAALGKTTR